MTTDTRTDKRRRLAVDLEALRECARAMALEHGGKPVLLWIGNGVHAGADRGPCLRGGARFWMHGQTPASYDRKPPAVYSLDGTEWFVPAPLPGSWGLQDWGGIDSIDHYHRGRKVTRDRVPVRVEEVRVDCQGMGRRGGANEHRRNPL